MRKGRAGSAARRRGGFTILELLVVVAVSATLMALILPAVVQARAAARRAACQNHFKQIGLGLVALTESNGRFPASGTFSPVNPDGFFSWVVPLLPWIDQDPIAKQWKYDEPFSDPHNWALASQHISVLACPDDITTVPGRGNLSYVVNGGFGWTEPVDCLVTLHPFDSPAVWAQPLDLNGNGVVCPSDPASDGAISDRTLLHRSGMFFVENWPIGSGTVRNQRPEHVLDGLSQTILAAENVRAGWDPVFPNSTSWACPEAWRSSFFLSAYVCNGLSCSVGNVDYARANQQSVLPYKMEAINAGLSHPEGQSPWPSSYHRGGVQVLFGDGRVVFMSENVNGLVYASLVTPQGSLLPGPLVQPSSVSLE